MGSTNLEGTMNALRQIRNYLLVGALGFLANSHQLISQAGAPATEAAHEQARDGQHDFDFNLGTPETHIKRLTNPLTGSTTWSNLNGTVTVRKLLNGRAQLEEIEADGPN